MKAHELCHRTGPGCVCVMACTYAWTVHWRMSLQQSFTCSMVQCSSACGVLPLTVVGVAPAHTVAGCVLAGAWVIVPCNKARLALAGSPCLLHSSACPLQCPE